MKFPLLLVKFFTDYLSLFNCDSLFDFFTQDFLSIII